jgi:hypothetical protein
MKQTSQAAERLAVFQLQLKAARRAIERARLKAAAADAVSRALKSIGGCSTLAAAAMLIVSQIGGQWIFPASVFCVLLAATLSSAVPLIRVWRNPVLLLEVAERLDLAGGDHNKIATAISLLKGDSPSPFAQTFPRSGQPQQMQIARKAAMSKSHTWFHQHQSWPNDCRLPH